MEITLVDLRFACEIEGEKVQPRKVMEDMAPEILNSTNYNENCDLWSCGMLLFFLISGESPYMMSDEKTMEGKIRSRKITYESRRWSGRSAEVMALLTSVLEPQPNKRPAASTCLNNSWLRSFSSEAKSPDMHSLLTGLQQTRQSNPWKTAVTRFILNRVLSREQLKSKTEMFNALNRNRDGYVSKEELKAAFRAIMAQEEAATAANQTVLALDESADNRLSYSEFLLIAADETQLLSVDCIVKVFSLLDQDHSEHIGIRELNNEFEAEDNSWKSLLSRIHKHPNDQLNWQEFGRLLGLQ